jgi:hypothetical protein
MFKNISGDYGFGCARHLVLGAPLSGGVPRSGSDVQERQLAQVTSLNSFNLAKKIIQEVLELGVQAHHLMLHKRKHG